MKTVLALLFFTIACHAQTLKWTFAVPQPSFEADSADVFYERSDAAGTLALSINYGKIVDPEWRFQIVWVSAKGKLIHNAFFRGSEDFYQGSIVSVSPTSLIVQLIPLTDAPSVLRKYTVRRGVVTFVDTPLAAHEFVRASESAHPNPNNFYAIAKTSGVVMSVKRFTAR